MKRATPVLNLGEPLRKILLKKGNVASQDGNSSFSSYFSSSLLPPLFSTSGMATKVTGASMAVMAALESLDQLELGVEMVKKVCRGSQALG